MVFFQLQILQPGECRMADELTQVGEFRFSVNSSLLFQLGEQLVAKPSIALAELVKNAYDADATKVTVTMEKISKEGGTILIEDDGHGMTLEEMQDSWMRIATSAKRRKNPLLQVLLPANDRCKRNRTVCITSIG